MKLRPLMVLKNTWYSALNGGYVILLSRDNDEDGMYWWNIAFSYAALGAQTMKWTDEEVERCEYLGYIADIWPLEQNIKRSQGEQK